MTQREVVLVSGVRTAIGSFGGSLKSVPPTELGAKVAAEAIRRSRVAATAQESGLPRSPRIHRPIEPMAV